jgi:hypothetical protein
MSLQNLSNELEDSVLDGDLQCARRRLMKFAEIANENLAAKKLNTLSFTIIAHLVRETGDRELVTEFDAELDAEGIEMCRRNREKVIQLPIRRGQQ